jgi:MscS family membrane protein
MTDTWFDMHAWAQAHLPHFMLRPLPRHFLLWQALALPLALALAWVLARGLGYVCKRTALYFARYTKAQLDDDLVEQLAQPLNLLLGAGIFFTLVRPLELAGPSQALINRGAQATAVIAVFWGAWRSVSVVHQAVMRSPWITEHSENRSLLLLLGRFGKIVIAAVAAVSVLQTLGYQVTALIAGLGIGGLAVALAAQKTLADVLGSVMLSLDRPFQVGDTIRIEDVLTADVEALGLRSTRLRTPDRTLVTMPNGRLADMRIENFTLRDRMRFASVLSLSPASTPEALENVLRSVRERVSQDAQIAPGSVVSLREVTPTSLNIDLIVGFRTTRYDQFITLREKLLLDVLSIVESSGAVWAPTAVVRSG